MQVDCQGLSQGNPTAYPNSKPKKSIPARNGIMLIIRHGDQLLLEKRPPQGIWGGLYCFPQVESLTEVTGPLAGAGSWMRPTIGSSLDFATLSVTSTSISAPC